MNAFEQLEQYTSTGSTSATSSSNPVDIFLAKLEKEGFNMDELKPAILAKGDKLIVSGAGSGKTTGIIFQILLDQVSGEATRVIELPGNASPMRVPESILVCTFLKSGADKLQEKLGYWQRKFGYSESASSIKFRTLHAEFRETLMQVGVKVTLMETSESMGILRKILARYGITPKDGGELTVEDFKNVDSAITYARNRLDEQRYNHPSTDDYGLTPILLNAIIEDLKKERRALNKMDFEDLQEVLLFALERNEKLQEFVANKYKFFYIDEFQDTSQIQYKILSYYLKGRKKVVAIGDDDQTIYSWRGSDIKIITQQFEKDYNPVVTTLTYNYRCPSSILNPVIPSILKNKERHHKSLQSSADGGDLKVYSSRTIFYSAEQLIEMISDDIKNGRSVGILTRTNFDAMLPSLLLEIDGRFDFSISSDSMTMSSRLPKQVMGLSSVFTDRSSNNLKNALTLCVDRYDKYGLNNLVDTLKVNKVSLFTIPEKDLKYSVPSLYELIVSLKHIIKSKNEVQAFIYLLGYVADKAYAGNSAYARGAKDFIGFLQGYLSNSKVTSVVDVREMFDSYNTRLLSRIHRKKVKINIATVHESKGKEWDSVYIWNDIDGVFPASRGGKDIPLLEYEEERRVHYIAWTRAKKKLTVFTQLGLESPFLMECDIKFEGLGNPKGVLK